MSMISAESKLIPYAASDEVASASVLVIAPHPDDEVLGCGGAILRHVEAGAAIKVIIVTDGALGLTGDSRCRHAWIRRAESRAAAEILGYGDPEFWDLPDQSLAYGEQLVMRIDAALDGVDLVYAPSIFEMHPDHRALAMATVEAVRRRGGGLRLALYEVATPLRPNRLVDISAQAERKRAAMRCFTSQLASQPYDQHIEALNRYRTYSLAAEVTAAEAFLVLDARDLQDDPFEIYRPEHRRQQALGLTLDSRAAPLVSVIVRSIDRPELADALDSVALQTYGAIEVVVVDARGDHRVLAPWCGRFPLRQVSPGQRLGRARAANVGLDATQGAYLIFLDDDDVFLPDHVAKLVAAIQAAPSARAAHSGVQVKDAAGVIDVYDEAFAPARLMTWNRLPILGVLFERALVDDGCRFDEALEIFEDWDFWLQVAHHGAFVHTPGISAVYRAHLGRSPLTPTAGSASAAASGRQKVWNKWLGLWSPNDLEELVADLRSEAQAARIQVAKSAAEAAQRHADTEAELATWRRSLEDMRRSTSWRLTAPLRAVVQMLRGPAASGRPAG
jgi:LmbE family N-acetylglucosaminyl deacetylase